MTEEALPRVLASRDSDRLRRYREYLDYYEGRRGSPPARGRERTLTFNYARAMVEKGASYLVTEHRPQAVPADETPAARRQAAEAERALLEVWEENDLARLDLETEVDTAVLGDGAFKVVVGRARAARSGVGAGRAGAACVVGGRRCAAVVAGRRTLSPDGGPGGGAAGTCAEERRGPDAEQRRGDRGVDGGAVRPLAAGRTR